MISLLLGALSLVPTLTQKSENKLSDYDFCVAHNAIVAQRDKSRTVSPAVKNGFDRCRAERETARKALMTTDGKADRLMNDNDRELAKQMTAEILEYRRTGKIPNNAQD